jgi:hypothetical protein
MSVVGELGFPLERTVIMSSSFRALVVLEGGAPAPELTRALAVSVVRWTSSLNAFENLHAWGERDFSTFRMLDS